MGLALLWEIKSSFLEYLYRLPDSAVEAYGGAQSVDGKFLYPAAAGTAWQFRGAVRFRGHGGMLDVIVADPRVEPDRGGWAVYVGDHLGEATASLTRFARFTGDGAALPAFRAGARLPAPVLTTLGSRILGDVYQAGTEIAPMRLVHVS
jgi:hypothetical protein